MYQKIKYFIKSIVLALSTNMVLSACAQIPDHIPDPNLSVDNEFNKNTFDEKKFRNEINDLVGNLKEISEQDKQKILDQIPIIFNEHFDDFKKLDEKRQQDILNAIPPRLDESALKKRILGDIVTNLKGVDENSKEALRKELKLPSEFEKEFLINDQIRTTTIPYGEAIDNTRFNVNFVSGTELFGHLTENSNSYRIPGVIKTHDGKIIVNADKRVENNDDVFNTIDQVYKVSSDNGVTWSYNQPIVKVSTPRLNKGLIIDGTMVEVEYPENNEKQYKLLYLFNLIGLYAGIRHFDNNNINPWFKTTDNKIFLKFFTKEPHVARSNANISFLKELENRPGWWRQYVLKSGKTYNNTADGVVDSHNLSFNDLEPTKLYVDNRYNSNTYTITGEVYENVELTDFNDPTKLATKATGHSIWDEYSDNFKYSIARNNFNALLESYDQGRTWTNFRIIDSDFAFPTRKKFVGNGVGSGIQLKHQSNPDLNGKIIFPMYDLNGGNNAQQNVFYIFSDDYGKTWSRYFSPATGINIITPNLSESKIIETDDGELYWLARNTAGKTAISKSIDGGITWNQPHAPSLQGSSHHAISAVGDGNVFQGLDYFKFNDQKYFIFSAPHMHNSQKRLNGRLFIADATFANVEPVWKFHTDPKEEFVYSYPLTIVNTEEYVEVLVLYEWSPRSLGRIHQCGANRLFWRTCGGGIWMDRFKITPKN